jgi:hypothetical protein
MKDTQKVIFNIVKSLKKPIVVEIGSWEGGFSYELLKQTDCILYCVDPYKKFDDDIYPDGMNNLSQEDFDNLFEKTKNKLSEFGDRIHFLRMQSHEAIKLFNNESIDLVYIDGNHEYKFVFSDIILWYYKVKPNFYLCGDDIMCQDLSLFDKDGNFTQIWSRNPDGTPNSWGKYGTYKALLDAQKIFDYEFSIITDNFIIKKLL